MLLIYYVLQVYGLHEVESMASQIMVDPAQSGSIARRLRDYVRSLRTRFEHRYSIPTPAPPQVYARRRRRLRSSPTGDTEGGPGPSQMIDSYEPGPSQPPVDEAASQHTMDLIPQPRRGRGRPPGRGRGGRRGRGLLGCV